LSDPPEQVMASGEAAARVVCVNVEEQNGGVIKLPAVSLPLKPRYMMGYAGRLSPCIKSIF
jgi:hypothetical protein